MRYRLTKNDLVDSLRGWNSFLKRKVRLIACGGTALTLMGIKDSTKDIDFLVPEKREYAYLISVLKDLDYEQVTGYGWRRKGEVFIFDLFEGSKVHATELLESPLEKGNNTLSFELSNIYVGILNPYDLLISKLFRGDAVDIEDCLLLVGEKRDEIDMEYFKKRYAETASYEISEDKCMKTFKYFLKRAADGGSDGK